MLSIILRSLYYHGCSLFLEIFRGLLWVHLHGRAQTNLSFKCIHATVFWFQFFLMNEVVYKPAACMIDFSVTSPAQKQLLVAKLCIRSAATYANLKIMRKQLLPPPPNQQQNGDRRVERRLSYPWMLLLYDK